MANDFLAGAPKHQTSQAAESSRTHHDQIISARDSHLDNGLGRVALEHFRLNFSRYSSNCRHCVLQDIFCLLQTRINGVLEIWLAQSGAGQGDAPGFGVGGT